MSGYLIPYFGAGVQVLNNQGIVASGALLTTYLGGSVNTLQTTYTDGTLSTPNTNPLVANSAGRFTQEIWVPGGVALKLVLTDANSNALGSWDNVAGINDLTNSGALTGEWTLAGNGTYVGSLPNIFSLVGNYSTQLVPYRRLKIGQSGGFIFGYVSYANPPVYSGGITTVTVITDGNASLTNPVSSVYYGFLNSQGPSSPNVFTGPVQFNGNIAPTINAYNSANTANWVTVANLNSNLNLGVNSYAGTGGLISGDTALFGEIMAPNGLSLAGNGGLSPQVQLTPNIINLLSSLQVATTTVAASTFSMVTFPNNLVLLNNYAAGTMTLTLGTATKGALLIITNLVAQSVVSASTNVVPLLGGAAASGILTNSIGKWCILMGNGTNWNIIAGN